MKTLTMNNITRTTAFLFIFLLNFWIYPSWANRSVLQSTVDCIADDQTFECAGLNQNQTNATMWNQANIEKLRACSYDLDGEITVTSDFDINKLAGDCGFTGAMTVTYSITDAVGSGISKVATLIIEDTTPPSFTCEPDDGVFECNGEAANRANADAWNQANMTKLEACATDYCASSTDVVVISDYDFANLSDECGLMGSMTVIYTITDDCGNFVEKTGTFTIKDEESPVANFGAGNSVINCPEVPNVKQFLEEKDAENMANIRNFSFDNCGEITVFSNFTPSVISDTCQSQPKITVTYTITDECGNIATIDWNFTILNREMSHPLCENLLIQSSNNQLTLSNVSAPNTIVKVYDPNWQLIYDCTATCENEIIVPVVGDGIYHTDIQFYDENWAFICEDKQEIEVIGGGEPCDTSICAGDVILRTQAEVDAFCGCEVIEGKLAITSTTIRNLQSFQNLKTIKGSLVITSNTELESIEGLNNLQSIGGGLIFGNNPLIIDFNGLRNLQTIGERLFIGDNGLKSLEGLENLGSIKNEVEIVNNNNLEKLANFSHLDTLSELLIGDNDQLITLEGLNNLKHIEGKLIVSQNEKLTECCQILHLVDYDLENGQAKGGIQIDNNTSFCNSQEEIIANCQTPPPTCESIQILTQNNQITISGLTAPKEIVKIFDKDYNIVYQCVANCAETQVAGIFPEGNYVVDLQLYDENWGFICAEQRAVVLENNNPCNTTNCLDEIPPVLVNIPTDLTVECDAIPETPNNITATDNCDSDVVVVFDEERTDTGCSDSYILTRTWTATDDCGNTATGQQRVVIEDTTPPVLTNLPPDISFNESEGFDTTFPIPTDNCDAEPTLTVDDVLNENETEIVRTFTATDNCGNIATARQIITIIKDNLCENITIATNENEITLSNISAPNAIVKVFDPNWQRIYDCTATCENEIIVPVVGDGIYHTDIQFYDENWQFICVDKQDVEVIGSGEPCDTSVCAGDVILRTQAEVDAFCGCEVIEGNLSIAPISSPKTDITSISNLKGLKRVTGRVDIVNNRLSNLNGLEYLNQVDDIFVINENDLENLDALSNLRIVGDVFAIVVTKIENLYGLRKLESVGNHFIIGSHENLKSLADLKSLTYIGGGLEINNCPINNLEIFNQIQKNSIDYIRVHRCPNIKSLDGLNNNTVYEEVQINECDSLENIDAVFKGVTEIKRLIIVNNPALSNCCALTHLIDEDSTNGKVLSQIVIQENIQFCNSPEEILQNCQPTSPCETTQIQSTNNQLSITNLSAPIEILKVFDADYNLIYECFADCEDSIRLSDLAAGRYHININFYDENWQHICEKNESVEVLGDAQNRNGELVPSDFALYPNPAEAEVFVDLHKLKGETVQLTLYNQFGQAVRQQKIEKVKTNKEKVDLRAIQNGLYILKIETKERKAIAKKLIINRLY